MVRLAALLDLSQLCRWDGYAVMMHSFWTRLGGLGLPMKPRARNNALNAARASHIGISNQPIA